MIADCPQPGPTPARSKPYRVLSELLADAAERSPEAAAVRSGAKELTYCELLDAVQRRAGQLAALGIGPGHRVAISMHKSVHSWISVHAVLWAGAAYVPIDPLSNGASRDALLADAAVSATLADSATAKSLAAADSTGQIIVVDSNASPELEPMPIGRVDVGPEAVAYIMYTSGSTGQPKGIVHTHASAMAYAVRAAECYGLKADDRMANIAPLHFDQSTFELFSSLVAAATVIVVPTPHIRMPASLVELVAGEKVTIWYSVPTILSQMVQRGGMENHDLTALRWVLFGGEVFPSATLARLMAALPRARFSNVYGPAEVNQCTFHHLTVAPRPDETIPIGRAWANTEIRVVGADGHSPVGDGESGELIVATDTMMSEYWMRPDLTAKAIFIDQDQPDSRRRWYRTGDMVRTNADGLLEFLGRRDRQVKVRGNRIELEAVESAIRDIKGVRGAAVVVIEGANQEIRLVAAVVSDSLNPTELNKAIAMRLPPHTRPDEVVTQTELPMTPTGKVDTIALARQISETAR